MFENLRRGKQARNFWKNVPKILDLKSSSEQIFSENCRWVPLNDAHSAAVKTVNRRLKQFSRQNGWKLISQANITQNGLNKGSLHLNREYNVSLHRNFVIFLRKNNWSPRSLNAESPVSVKLPYVSRSNTSYDLSNLRKTAASKPPCLPNSLPANRGFKIASLNVKSLIKHIDDLRIFLADNPVDVLAIQFNQKLWALHPWLRNYS